MRYIVSGEFTKIDETSGTIQNTSKINVVEVSDTNEKGSGIMLYPLDRFTFSKSIYARCVDGGGAEVRVVPFEVGTQGGGEQGATPGGGGSGIAFAGMILGTESSTVDGGLWFEIVDGLPIVKMNHNGGEFLIDTKPAEDALIGNKLYLGGHEFKLTGFASGLTFSDNNFYAANTVVGSVSNFAFQFTDAAALNVAAGGTISITQLDTDAVNLSLDLDSLNSTTTATPWDASGYKTGNYTYNSGVEADYLRTDTATYTFKSGSQTSQALTLTLAKQLFGSKWRPSATLEDSAPYVTVEEIYNDDVLSKFVVTINSDTALTGKSGTTPIDTITATAPAGVEVEFKFADGVYYGYGEHQDGSLTYNIDGSYTFKTDTNKEGYGAAVTSTDEEGKTVTTLNLMQDMPSTLYWGDQCNIIGLAPNLSVLRIDNYSYEIRKDVVIVNGEILDSGTLVGSINQDTINITDTNAFANIREGIIATVIDLEELKTPTVDYHNIWALAYKITLADALKTYSTVAEGFTYKNGAYVYHTGKVAAHLAEDDIYYYDDWNTTSSKSIRYVPEVTTATIDGEDFDCTIGGLSDLGELVIVSNTIQTTDGTTVGIFDADSKYINVGTYGSNHYTLAAAGYPAITLSGNNNFTLRGRAPIETDVDTYSNSDAIDFYVDTYNADYTVSGDGKTATYHSQGTSYRRIILTPPSGYKDYFQGGNAIAVYWRLTENGDTSTDILFAEFNGQDWVFNSHAFDGVTTADTINITNYVRSTPLNFNIELATDADTLAISRTFANETFTAGATAGTYTYTATGSTAGWNVSADETKIASWELNGKTFTIENLRTDLGTIGFDSQGYIHATNGSTIGRMGGNVIKLYDTAVHKLATPILTGADAADFTLILPS